MSKNYNAIVQFYDNKCKIEGLYCVAMQLTAEYNGEVKTLAMYSDETEKQYLEFGENSDILSAQFDDFVLYLSRTTEIEITELIVVPLHPAFNINTTPHVEVTIENNQIQLMSIAQNQSITKVDIDALCDRINAEATRRNASGSVGAVTTRSTKPSTSQQIAVGTQTIGGTYANIARPLNTVQTVSNPAVSSKILATGAGSFGYLSTLVDTLSRMGPTGSSGCNSSCTGLCSTGCYSGCTSCTGGCQGTCQGNCGNNCTGSCSGGCSSSCYGGCDAYCEDTDYNSCGGDCTYMGGGECC